MAAFNGSGTFSRSYNWVVDRIAGTPITDTRMDTEMDGVATGLSSCIVKDGQTTATARIPFAVGIGMNDGTSALPAINFTGDTNTGIYRIGADNIGITCGGTKVVDLTASGATFAGTFAFGDGTVSAPGINFASDTNSGIYRIGADNLGIAANGANVLDISATGLGVTGTTLTGNGTVSNPGFSFVSDPDSGIYRVGANALSIALAGAAVLALTTGGAAVTGTLSASGATTLAAVSATTGAFSGALTAIDMTVTSTASSALTVGPSGSTNPTVQIDSSTTSAATGIKIKSAAAAAGVAISAISSGTNENLTIDAKGSGTVTLGGTSTGAITLTRATTMSAALTYGGVTLSNAVTGTGNMVLSGTPTITSPIITNIAPGANFTLTQNSVAAITSVESGALSNTLYLSAGRVGIGNTTLAATALYINRAITGSTTGYMINASSAIQSDVTAAAYSYYSAPSTAVAAFTCTSYLHFRSSDVSLGAGSAVTKQYGVSIGALASATNNYGVHSSVAVSGTANWNIYAVGTAPNYFGGPVGVGSTTLGGSSGLLRVAAALTGNANPPGIYFTSVIQSDVTGTAALFYSVPSTVAEAFTVTALQHFRSNDVSVGATSAVTNQYGFFAAALTSATNNYGFHGNLTSGSNRYNLYMIGTAANVLAGITTFSSATASTSTTTGAIVLSGSSAGVGIAGALWAGGLINSAAGITAFSGTAIPAGGTAGSGFKFSSTANYGVFFGSGAPTLTAAKGSLYLRNDGSSTSTRAYINTDGGTTWTAITTAA